MKARTNKRIIVWGVAVAVLAAALLFAAPPPWSDAAEEPVIDTAAPVAPTSCAPCHLDLGDVNVPGLVFSHGNHLLVSCDGCHSRMPHRGETTERVPMEVCFACHGVTHSDMGELATAQCEDCHTPSFDLRPRSHTRSWDGTPHVSAADARGVNSCMMCHRDPAKQCDECHEDKAPEVGPMPDVYHPMVGERPKGPSVNILPKGKVSMSQCIYCHPDIDDILPGRLIFAHATHIQRNYSCESCHERFAHTETGIVRPDMMSCYRCHGLNHNSDGQVATEECDACHPKEFDLKPDDHTMRFILKTHGKQAIADPAYCAMCHKSEFCIGCHRGEKVSENAPGKPVIPADHRKATWIKRHGPLFLDGDGACGSCHDDKSCKRCHKTVMPHPVGWIENHRPPAGVPREDCNVCHTDRESCQDCHHSKVKRADLTRENCVPCHDEMRQTPATAIKHKGFAEHAVHFNVADVKGEPYGCWECHIELGSSAAAERLELQQGHDLRLCYGCHGALDPNNRLIADYKGASLCIRCHTDVGL